MRTVAVLLSLVLSGCLQAEDDNAKPVFGKDLGLPVNCRAYVQESIDGYRAKKYTADEAMNGLECNCGTFGNSWKNNREK